MNTYRCIFVQCHIIKINIVLRVGMITNLKQAILWQKTFVTLTCLRSGKKNIEGQMKWLKCFAYGEKQLPNIIWRCCVKYSFCCWVIWSPLVCSIFQAFSTTWDSYVHNEEYLVYKFQTWIFVVDLINYNLLFV